MRRPSDPQCRSNQEKSMTTWPTGKGSNFETGGGDGQKKQQKEGRQGFM